MLLLVTMMFSGLCYYVARWYMTTQQELTTQLGKVILFCGVETSQYGTLQWNNVATFCRAHGVDTVLVKVADGGGWWYGGPTAVGDIRNQFKNLGVGFIPYGYFYGNKFGAIWTEIGIVRLCLQLFGYMCMDLEVELNGDTQDAMVYANAFRSHTGILLCSTWADPQLQNWVGVLDALRGSYDAFMPQEYTNYLDSTEYQLSQEGIQNMIPTIYLGGDIPGNDPYQVAVDIQKRGHSSISLWYDGFAMVSPALVDRVVSLFKASPAPTPAPPPQKGPNYMDTQLAEVYAANQYGQSIETGIGQTIKAAFDAHKITACYPTGKEIDTVDWSGNKIKFQAFSNGVHAEYNIASGHCNLFDPYGVKLWG